METEEVLGKHAVISIGKIRDSEAAAFQKTVREINAIPLIGKYPFFIVKPYGMNRVDEIIGYLKEQGIVILEHTVIRNWAEFSLLLYADYAGKKGNGGALFRIARNRAFRRFEGKRGLCLRIEKEVPLGKIYRIKSDLRRWFGEERRVMAYDGKTFTLHANVIHSIDQKDLEWTNKVVNYLMNRKRR